MSGLLLLGAISLVAITDVAIAMWFSAKANRADSDLGIPRSPDASDPRVLRRVAYMLLITAPLMWLVVAALSFGLIPTDGITPIKF